MMCYFGAILNYFEFDFNLNYFILKKYLILYNLFIRSLENISKEFTFTIPSLLF